MATLNELVAVFGNVFWPDFTVDNPAAQPIQIGKDFAVRVNLREITSAYQSDVPTKRRGDFDALVVFCFVRYEQTFQRCDAVNELVNPVDTIPFNNKVWVCAQFESSQRRLDFRPRPILPRRSE